MSRACLSAALLCLPLVAFGDEATWQVDGGVGVERLSNGSPDWRQVDLALRRRLDRGVVLEFAARQAQRYGATDHELGIGGSCPVENWNLSLRATTAGQAAFLPRHGISFDAARRLDGGWVANAGATRNLFSPADAPASGTTLLRLAVERYVADWRFLAGLTHGRLDGGAAANGWRLQADRFFGESGRIGMLVADGRELEATTGGVISTRVNSIVLLARWRIAAGWSFNADVGRTHVDDIIRQTDTANLSLPGGYHRDGVHFGVQHEF